MKIKNFQINAVSQVLGGISFPNDISVDSIVGLIGLKSELDELNNKLQAAASALFKSYEIEPNAEGGYQWGDHLKADEITAKWNELSNKEHKLAAHLTQPNLYAIISKGLHIQQVLLLKEVLN